MKSTPVCQCPAPDAPFTCDRSGCLMTVRAWQLCSGNGCTPAQHRKYARHFAGQDCRDHIADVNKMVSDPGIPDNSKPLGPGGHMKRLLETLGIVAKSACGCNALRVQMDQWGPNGCRENRAVILELLGKNAKKVSWRKKIKHAVKAAKHGIWLNPLDPLGSLLDRAITLAEESNASR